MALYYVYSGKMLEFTCTLNNSGGGGGSPWIRHCNISDVSPQMLKRGREVKKYHYYSIYIKDHVV